MAPVAALAEQVRENRKPVAADNPFLALQETMSRQIVAALDAWRDVDAKRCAERTFLAVYGSPALQAAVGIDPRRRRPPRKAGEERRCIGELLQTRIAELQVAHRHGRPARMPGPRRCSMSAWRAARVDERGFELIRRIRAAHGRACRA